VHKGKLFPGGSSSLWYLSTPAKCFPVGQFRSQVNPSARQSRSPSLLGMYAITEERAEQRSSVAHAAPALTNFCCFRAVYRGSVPTENNPMAWKKCSDSAAVCYT